MQRGLSAPEHRAAMQMSHRMTGYCVNNRRFGLRCFE